MLQSNVAWYQLVSFHPASCIAVSWRLDDPDPFPQGPPIPQGGGAGYHCSIYILNLSYFPFVILFDLVFKFMILTFILVTYFSIHACLAWNQLSSSCFSIHQHSSSYLPESLYKMSLWKNEWWLKLQIVTSLRLNRRIIVLILAASGPPLPLPPTMVIARLDRRINPPPPSHRGGGGRAPWPLGGVGGGQRACTIYVCHVTYSIQHLLDKRKITERYCNMYKDVNVTCTKWISSRVSTEKQTWLHGCFHVSSNIFWVKPLLWTFKCTACVGPVSLATCPRKREVWLELVMVSQAVKKYSNHRWRMKTYCTCCFKQFRDSMGLRGTLPSGNASVRRFNATTNGKNQRPKNFIAEDG